MNNTETNGKKFVGSGCDCVRQAGKSNCDGEVIFVL